ncbi:hypothetical protein Dsin_013186 [Dipteronia sinensis]|uniref:DUF1985 domain-containing protein n=1 Tax=Dipteronia sinensis TaxID=43782 RepID=A0AAE0E8R6_9ROSI|nr:hypothetical protein Dsin_013186 [Dipteronia sinensis]
MVEFCLITGLKFEAISDTDVFDEVENGIHQSYFGGRDVVTFSELDDQIQQGQWEQPFDAVKLCLLLMVNCVIHGLDERHYVPIWQMFVEAELTHTEAERGQWYYKRINERGST